MCVAEYVCARKDVGFSAAAVVLKDEGDFEVCTKKKGRQRRRRSRTSAALMSYLISLGLARLTESASETGPEVPRGVNPAPSPPHTCVCVSRRTKIAPFFFVGRGEFVTQLLRISPVGPGHLSTSAPALEAALFSADRGREGKSIRRTPKRTRTPCSYTGSAGGLSRRQFPGFWTGMHRTGEIPLDLREFANQFAFLMRARRTSGYPDRHSPINLQVVTRNPLPEKETPNEL